MKFVFVGYTSNEQYQDPQAWLFRIRAYLGVLEALARQHTVISIEQIGYTGVLQQRGVEYHFIKPIGRRNYFPRQLHRFIAAQSPDIILVHGMEHPLQVWQLRRTVGAGPVIIVQSHSSKLPSWLKTWMQKITDTSVNAYFFSSRSMAIPWLQKGLIANSKKVYEVPVGSSVFIRVEKSIARKRVGINEATVFLWAGRLDKNKDPLTVVQAFLRYAAIAPGAGLYMIFQQDDLLHKLQQLLEGNEFGKRVTLVGKLGHDAMGDWFSSADFFISSSYFEVYGAAVAEAMSCGCIPILSDIPAYRSITANGACGYLFEPGNSESLFRVMLRSGEMDLALEEVKIMTLFGQRLSFNAIAEKISQIGAYAKAKTNN
jgi:glycosyltransferase involved in cell wall biosynthesis